MDIFKGLRASLGALLSPFEKKAINPVDYPKSPAKPLFFAEETRLILGKGKGGGPYLYAEDESLEKGYHAFLIGPDLKALSSGPFAHIVFLRFAPGLSEERRYRLLRDAEYLRYRIWGKGLMLRVNTNALEEGLFLSDEAKDLSFAGLAYLYESAYSSLKEIEGVEEYFLTDPSAPYDKLSSLARSAEGILLTLDHLFKSITMDCASCAYKGVCDAVDGLRELHKGGSKP